MSKKTGCGLLWLKRSVQNDEHYSDGRVVSAKNTDLMFCRDFPGTGPVCRPVAFTDQEGGQSDQGSAGNANRSRPHDLPLTKSSGSSVSSVSTDSQDNDLRNKNVAAQCRELCTQFVAQSRTAIPDAQQRSKLALRCVEQCRMSGVFLMCMTQTKIEELWDKCSQKID